MNSVLSKPEPEQGSGTGIGGRPTIPRTGRRGFVKLAAAVGLGAALVASESVQDGVSSMYQELVANASTEKVDVRQIDGVLYAKLGNRVFKFVEVTANPEDYSVTRLVNRVNSEFANGGVNNEIVREAVRLYGLGTKEYLGRLGFDGNQMTVNYKSLPSPTITANTGYKVPVYTSLKSLDALVQTTR